MSPIVGRAVVVGMGVNLTDDLIVDRHHPLSGVVVAALRDGQHQGEGTPAMMARAVKAVLVTDPTMTITDAYNLVNRLWVG